MILIKYNHYLHNHHRFIQSQELKQVLLPFKEQNDPNKSFFAKISCYYPMVILELDDNPSTKQGFTEHHKLTFTFILFFPPSRGSSNLHHSREKLHHHYQRVNNKKQQLYFLLFVLHWNNLKPLKSQAQNG